MIRIRGLLFKTLVMINVVAMVSLAASYGFVTAQQAEQFKKNISLIKENHARSTQLMLNQQLQEQILAAEELSTLLAFSQQTAKQTADFFDAMWPRIQLSFSLTSLSLANESKQIIFGPFPEAELSTMQRLASFDLRAQSGIVCHVQCELAASIPLSIKDKQFSLTLLSDISPSIVFLTSVVNSDIGILQPNILPANNQKTLQRYITQILTGYERNEPLFTRELSDEQFDELEQTGLLITVGELDYYLWFEEINSIGQSLQVLFIRDISQLMQQQENQKQQVIIIFVTVTLGILLTLILFSIIPISQINKLRKAIKLIGAKQYNTARFRLGEPKKRKHMDELYDLEFEFRNAIDLLENYEQELDTSQKKLVRQATIDSITGLFTRNVLIDDISRTSSEEMANNIAIFFLDLDGFKPVNDNLGHEAGDIMLKKIGYRLKGVSNKFIKVYRIGGDEFVIAYNNYSGDAALLKMADAIVDLFSAPFNVYETNITISASIGIAINSEDELEPDQLLRYADIAMYQAKEEGKNRYKFFDESMRAKTKMRFTIKNDFIASLAGNQLFIVFQPIVSSETMKVVKLEALCRWFHPTIEFIPPPVFIDVLEESENMNILFEWIVSQVLEEIRLLDNLGMNEVIVSVNLSPSQLVDDTALIMLNEKLDILKISPSRIELEITETTLITNFRQASEWVNQANQLGFRVAIDDFGAGYSSLSYLSSFKYDTVKLDRSLLDKIDTDEKQQRIVGSLTQMIHGLSVPIVAEGAETVEQFDTLIALGCDFIQGYYISKPVIHDDLVLFLREYEIQQTNIPSMRNMHL